MRKNKTERKAYFANVVVWHDKNRPENASSYIYLLGANNENHAKTRIKAEIKSYRYHKHNIRVLEQVDLEGDLRQWSSTRLEYDILKQAAMQQEISDFAQELLEENYENCSADLLNLLKNPEILYDFVKENLREDSKVLIYDGRFHIYNKERSGDTLLEEELKRREEDLKESMEKATSKDITALKKTCESLEKKLQN